MKPIALGLAVSCLSLAAAAEPATYSVDALHTFVTFEVLHSGISTSRGRFDKKEGTVTLDRVAKTGKVDVTLDMAAISTGVLPFDAKMRSKDYFNVAAFPSARFVGEQFSFAGDKLSAVDGQLTLLGKTLPVTLKATRFNCELNAFLKREVCGGDFETTIARSQWGMTQGLPGIPDSVHLVVQVEAIKQ